MTKYTIKNISESHLLILLDALNLYFRIGMGQFGEILHVIEPKCERDAARNLIEFVKKQVTGMDEGSYLGILSKDLSDRFKSACDMHSVLRHARAWHNEPNGGIRVDFDTPLEYGNLPLVECEVTNE